MDKLSALIVQKRQFLLYCVCGGSGVTTDYILYHILIKQFEVWYQGANVAGYFAGTLISFVLNRTITFKVHDRPGKRLVFFLGTAAIGYGLSAMLLWILVDNMHVDSSLSKLMTLPMVVLLQFMLNKRITFA